jgi:hypothetical protein
MLFSRIPCWFVARSLCLTSKGAQFRSDSSKRRNTPDRPGWSITSPAPCLYCRPDRDRIYCLCVQSHNVYGTAVCSTVVCSPVCTTSWQATVFVAYEYRQVRHAMIQMASSIRIVSAQNVSNVDWRLSVCRSRYQWHEPIWGSVLNLALALWHWHWHWQ